MIEVRIIFALSPFLGATLILARPCACVCVCVRARVSVIECVSVCVIFNVYVRELQ
jgi:hypothetical protein